MARRRHPAVEITEDRRAKNGRRDSEPAPTFNLTDQGNAERLVHRHGEDLRHVRKWERWMVWDGTRWQPDETGEAERRAKETAKAMYHEADPGGGGSIDRTLAAHALKTEARTRIEAMVALARSEASIAITPDALDTAPWSFNVQNGTLDLRTGELRPHDPADRITKVTRAAYRPAEAGGATWAGFLEQVLPDVEVRSFLQRVVGVALLGKVVEHILPILTGTGANGKGVTYSALLHALGDYAAPAEPDLFHAREGAHPVGQMDLMGRRLVVVSESDKGRRLAEATMKRLTGGDVIKARQMRQSFVAFQPSHTALLVTNHLPKVSGDDDAIWRRVRVVPFQVVIPEEQRDPHLGDRLGLEADSVLSWAVQGYADYVSRGNRLAEPQSVLVATADYRTESDAVARFLAERCYLNPNVRATTSDLFDAFTAWAITDGAEAMSQKAFGQALDRRGAQRRTALQRQALAQRD